MKKLNNKGFTLVELLVVIGILTVLLAAILVAINPVRQFQQARDSQRRNDVLAILNAVQHNMADNKGTFTGTLPNSLTVIKKIAGADICTQIVPNYISALPMDPGKSAFVDCAAYDSGYSIMQDGAGRITVQAAGEVTNPISVIR